MKRLIFITLILSGLIGCTALKKSGNFTNNSRYTSTERTDSAAISRNDSTIIDKSKTTITDKSETETEVKKSEGSFSNSIVYFFDTSRPVDLVTGLPPVSSIFDNRSGTYANTQFSAHQKNSIRTEIENDIRKEFENILDIQTKNHKKTVDNLNQELKQKENTVSKMKLILIGSIATFVIILLFTVRKLLF